MQLLEHEAKRHLASVGLSVPRGGLADTATEAARVAVELGGDVMVKAQVPMSGRAAAGGVCRVPAARAGEVADRILSSAVGGHSVRLLLVEEALEAKSELYVGVAFQPAPPFVALLVGREGGSGVETSCAGVASVPVPALVGLRPHHIWSAGVAAGLDSGVIEALVPVAVALYDVLVAMEARLVEVNPLLVRPDGALVVADARVVAFHQEGTTPSAHRAAEIRSSYGFDFVELDPTGDVGLLTTGAGATMLLVDLLTAQSLRVLNFCDLRTGGMRGDPTRLLVALDELSRHDTLRCIALNIFAGVTDLAEFTRAFELTVDARPLSVPLVARLEGNEATTARTALRKLGITVVDTLGDLVQQVHEAVTASRVSVGAREEDGGSPTDRALAKP